MGNTPLIVYHADCADGFTAAWVAHRFFLHSTGRSPELRRGVYGQGAVMPKDVEDRDVYLLDFSYRRAHVELLAKSARSVTILDHHESAWKEWGEMGEPGSGKEALLHKDGNIHAYFRRDQSGAMVAWMHFNPNLEIPLRSAADRDLVRQAIRPGMDMEALLLVQYVEDRDLWRFALPNSREINAWVFSHEYTLGNWDLMADLLNDRAMYGKAVVEGSAIERKHFKDIREFMALGTLDMVVGGRLVPTLNVPYHWGSDACHMLLEEYPAIPFSATWFDRGDGRRVFSLRSRKGGANVAEIARSYGGGRPPAVRGLRAAGGLDRRRAPGRPVTGAQPVEAAPWATMESAPRDGSAVLAWSRTWKNGMQVVRWDRGAWRTSVGAKVSPTHFYAETIVPPKM